jgi:hypothetical protein
MDAVAKPRLLDVSNGPLDDAGKIEQHTVECRIPLKDSAKRTAVSAADVGDGDESRKVVGIQHGCRLRPVNSDHGLVEDRRLFGILRQKLEDRFPEDSLKGGFASADAVKEFAPRLVMLLSHHDRHLPLRTGNAAAQELSGGRQPESLVRFFSEDSETGQRSKESVKRQPIRVGLSGELVN